MLSLILPTLNAAAGLPQVLAAARAPIVGEVVVADGGSTDGTPVLAAALGARVVAGRRGRGAQLAAGAAAARGDWLLFLHADTLLGAGWPAEAAAFIADSRNAERAACFRFRLDDAAAAARRLERLVAWRCRVLGLPYGDQGLLIARPFHDRLGGFRPLPLMEDVDMVRRIGRRRLTVLAADAVTSAARYRRDGYVLRPVRNLLLLSLYFAGLPPPLLERWYR